MGKLINAFRKYTSPEIPKTLQGMEDDIGDTGIEMLKSMAPQRAWIKPVIFIGAILVLGMIIAMIATYAEPPVVADALPTPTPIAAEGTPVPANVLEEQFPAVYGIFNTIPYLMAIVVAGVMAMALMRVMRA